MKKCYDLRGVISFLFPLESIQYAKYTQRIIMILLQILSQGLPHPEPQPFVVFWLLTTIIMTTVAVICQVSFRQTIRCGSSEGRRRGGIGKVAGIATSQRGMRYNNIRQLIMQLSRLLSCKREKEGVGKLSQKTLLLLINIIIMINVCII